MDGETGWTGFMTNRIRSHCIQLKDIPMKYPNDLGNAMPARKADGGEEGAGAFVPDCPDADGCSDSSENGWARSFFGRFDRVSPSAGKHFSDGEGVGMMMGGRSSRKGSDSARLSLVNPNSKIPQAGVPSREGHLGFPSSSSPSASFLGVSARYGPEVFAQASLPLILEGETGTGKEFLARMIHENSPRKNGPFVVLDATHFSSEIADALLFGHRKGTFTGATGDQKGRLELSDKGTLFIDELQNMSLAIQMKLLRFLDRKTLQPLGSSTEISIDARVLVATNEPLSTLLSSGRLRPDFFYRIRGKTIRIPSLRDQVGEIPSLIEWKWKKWQEETKTQPPILSKDGIRTLQSYSWPGNIRELFSFLDCLLATFLPQEKVPLEWIRDELKSLQIDLSGSQGPDKWEDLEIERELIVGSLRSSGGEIAKASELMGMSRTTLWRKMKKLGIRPFEGV